MVDSLIKICFLSLTTKEGDSNYVLRAHEENSICKVNGKTPQVYNPKALVNKIKSHPHMMNPIKISLKWM